MRRYIVKYNPKIQIDDDVFDDIQYKHYGIRAKQDRENGLHRVIPYTSIYFIEIEDY